MRRASETLEESIGPIMIPPSYTLAEEFSQLPPTPKENTVSCISAHLSINILYESLEMCDPPPEIWDISITFSHTPAEVFFPTDCLISKATLTVAKNKKSYPFTAPPFRWNVEYEGASQLDGSFVEFWIQNTPEHLQGPYIVKACNETNSTLRVPLQPPVRIPGMRSYSFSGYITQSSPMWRDARRGTDAPFTITADLSLNPPQILGIDWPSIKDFAYSYHPEVYFNLNFTTESGVLMTGQWHGSMIEGENKEHSDPDSDSTSSFDRRCHRISTSISAHVTTSADELFGKAKA